ncbi:MAG: GNAT family N-acetyltransferase [Prevotella sp.]|jgi:phosphinothricin acetyltransferase
MIRPVEEKDVPALTAIYNHYITETTATFETEPISEDEMAERVKAITAEGPYLVDEEDGKVVGYIYAHKWHERAAYAKTFEVTEYLAQGYTHHGIGTALLEQLLILCRQQGLHALVACITAENTPSRKMYEKNGFQQVSLFKEVGYKFGRWLDVSDYERILS